MTLPSSLEKLAQDCFYEGARSSYSWMDSVEVSLVRKYFGVFWNRLRDTTERKDFATIARWVNQEGDPFGEDREELDTRFNARVLQFGSEN